MASDEYTEDETPTTPDREAILRRRRRFLAMSLTGVTTSTLATACPCLSVDPAAPHSDPEPVDASAEAAEGDDVEQAGADDAGAPESEPTAEPEGTDEPEG